MSSTIIAGLQWGDEGKGKIVDYLSSNFDAAVRFQGGHNAGHTIVANGQSYKLSLIPSAIIRNKLSIIGSGVVVDPFALKREIESLKNQKIDITSENLIIADNAPLILSFHRNLDELMEIAKEKESFSGTKIGTTKRGIGPSYEDMIGRRSIRICDVFDKKNLPAKILTIISHHNLFRKTIGLKMLSADDVMEEIKSFEHILKTYTKSPYEIASILENKNAILEGAQGALLDVNYGSYPFVTSSNTIPGQAFIGSCMPLKNINKIIGAIKAYCTRVGEGPFPTELNNEIGEKIALAGNEFGTVTNRKRRCGWLDLAVIRNIVKLSNIDELALMKIDVLDNFDKIKICNHYEYKSKKYDYMPSSMSAWNEVKPVYLEFEGWKCNISNISKFNDLPINAKKYIDSIEELIGIKIKYISTSPKRENVIIR